ncbi:DNA-binding protein SMUBP-2 [Nephila pilipes]|uniref:DNA helicase n=1 Tax=Nephila pilipes TaxID=299642 RepID=A0A8X6QJZ2_NEPPI|nr:DNA-binding protein SMUBP-2 [Nephila pilipes]
MAQFVDYFDNHAILHECENFALRHLELLEFEREAAIEKNKFLSNNFHLRSLQEEGIFIPNVYVSRTSFGLNKRVLIDFKISCGNKSLSNVGISAGDIIGIGSSNIDELEIVTSGVVSQVMDTAVSVALAKNDVLYFDCDKEFFLVKLPCNVTYKRMERAMKFLKRHGREHHLVNVLFGCKKPSVFQESSIKDLSFYNDSLNNVQKEAVRFALSQKEVAIIHGPPGTGKTTTVVECILQAISQKLKVLACAPSNVAVDNLVQKLAGYEIKMVRLGHPARISTIARQYCFEAIEFRHESWNEVEKISEDIDEILAEMDEREDDINILWDEYEQLCEQLDITRISIKTDILNNCDVILCTLTSAVDDGPLKYLNENHFDVCFIDECAQAIEAACWIPLLMVKKCILAGDHHQLPPTIISKKAASEGLKLTLMERLLKLYGDEIMKMLTIQYRMNEIIMEWPSKTLYKDKLVAHKSVQSHLLSDLPGIESNSDTTVPLLLIDTTGYSLHEFQGGKGSKGNDGEAYLVVLHVNNLIKSGLNPEDIAVITPYKLQIDLIKSKFGGLYPNLEVNSADGFQGKEKEAVVLSLVRSNDMGVIGFLAEKQRINVIITRAKRHLTVICDSKTVSHDGYLKSFVTYCAEKGQIKTASQFIEEINQKIFEKYIETSRSVPNILSIFEQWTIHETSGHIEIRQVTYIGKKIGTVTRSSSTQLVLK